MAPANHAMGRTLVPGTFYPRAEMARLAQECVRRGVFSPGAIEDALHGAVAVVSRQDMVVRRSIILMGYPTIEILAPPEV